MKRLGVRIKRHRDKLGLGLTDLAKRVGVSASALSQIENGKAFPSIITLKSIANSLYTTVGDLIGENEMLAELPLVKKGERKYVKTNATGAEIFLLSHHDNSKQMETFLIDMPAESDCDEVMIEHKGQEFIYLIRGKIKISLEGKEFELEQGDSFYYDSSIKHEVKNINDSLSSLIWIITPPNL